MLFRLLWILLAAGVFVGNSNAEEMSLRTIINSAMDKYNEFNDARTYRTYSLLDGEKIRVHLINIRNENGVFEDTEYFISLLGQFFPISEQSGSANLLTVIIGPDSIKNIVNSKLKIAGVEIPSSAAEEKCYVGMRELTDGDRKGQFGYVAVDSIQRTNSINKCLYIGVTKLFGISKPFSHFLTSEQSKYMSSIAKYMSSIGLDGHP